jgi:lipoate-protein ligase A
VIHKLQYYIGKGYNPYNNLALEECFLDNLSYDACLLYLWQNQKTVVIGRNQNAWQECKVEKLAADGGFLARRPSGGGAVFHDLGNLNFTFLVNHQDYDVKRQLSVILKAVQSLGIEAQLSGRNDITCQGRKFSGNAFYRKGNNCYHHGTLLMNVDMDQMAHYLQVDIQKLQSKGVTSVRSRVMNLKEACPEITVAMLQESLLTAFGQVYGLEPQAIDDQGFDRKALERYQEKYSSWAWRFGRPIAFTYKMQQRFNWGGLELQFKVNEGKIEEAGVYSDAMEEALIARLPQLFEGAAFTAASIEAALETLLQQAASQEEKQIVLEIQSWIGGGLHEG